MFPLTVEGLEEAMKNFWCSEPSVFLEQGQGRTL